MSRRSIREAESPVELSIVSRSPEETFRLGEFFGMEAAGGEVIGLSGPLGVGKTVFVKGLATGMGVTDAVSSPTFIIVHPHEGRLPLYHIDLYRLEKGSDFAAIGLEEYLQENGVAALEWIERRPELLPSDRLIVELCYAEGDQRKIALTASGARSIRWIEKVRPLLSEGNE